MYLIQNELFPLYTMMIHLPVEFILLPPTCKTNLIGCYSDIYSVRLLKEEIISPKYLIESFLP